MGRYIQSVTKCEPHETIMVYDLDDLDAIWDRHGIDQDAALRIHNRKLYVESADGSTLEIIFGKKDDKPPED